MDINAIEKLLENLSKVKVLVIGDVGIDSYVVGQVKKISPEAPVPVVEVEESYNRLGLAANVINNISALGGSSQLIGVVGNDHNASYIKDELKGLGVDTDGLVVDHTRPTTHKTRVLASRLHHVVRIDREGKKPLENDIRGRVLDNCRRLIPESDIVIIEDYAKGLFNKDGLSQEVIEICGSCNIPVFIDPSRYTNPLLYKGATLLKPNVDEVEILSGIEIDGEDSFHECGRSLLSWLDLKHLVITRGREGMTIFSKNTEPETIPTFALEVFDVSGAGDTVIAALALAYSSGATLYDSVFFANAAAAIVVGKVGTSVPTPKEIIEFIEEHKS